MTAESRQTMKRKIVRADSLEAVKARIEIALAADVAERAGIRSDAVASVLAKNEGKRRQGYLHLESRRVGGSVSHVAKPIPDAVTAGQRDSGEIQ